MKLIEHTLTHLQIGCLALLWHRVQALDCPDVPPNSPTRTFASLDLFQKNNVSFSAQDSGWQGSRANFSFAVCARLPRLRPAMGAYLDALDLRNKSMESIANAAFANLSCLSQLDLSQNRLSVLSNRTFEGLANLLALNLSSNELAALSPGAFWPLSALRWLDLAFNLLQGVVSGAFKRSPALEMVDVSHNEMMALPQCVQGMAQLSELYLEHNAIAMFSASDFISNANLTRVDLMHNQMVVANFSVNATTSWPSLRFLNFSGNFLTTLNVTDTRRLFGKTDTCLDLNHNSFRCGEWQALFEDLTKGHVCVWPGQDCLAPLHDPEKSRCEESQAFSFKYIAIALTLIGAVYCLLLAYDKRCNRADLHRLRCPAGRRAAAFVDDMDYVHLESAF